MVFLLKKDSDTIPEEEVAAVIQKLQELGIALDAYNGSFHNNVHPNALEDKRKYDNAADIPPKKHKLENIPSNSHD